MAQYINLQMAYAFDCITEFIFAETALEPADIILVPGGSPIQLAERAARLYYENFAPYILFSGHHTPNLPAEITECDYLTKVACALGVPEQAIIRERRARNTFENATFSWQALQAQSLAVKKAILVCKHFHSRRALLTYQSVFPPGVAFYVAPVIDERDIRQDNWYEDESKIKKVMSEVEKIGRYFADRIPNLVQKPS